MTKGSHRIGAAATTLAAVLMHLWIQAGGSLSWRGYVVGDFRNYYIGDQLSYLGIVANVADGHGAATEPFTLTGSNYYPRGYYVALGWVCRLVDVSPATAWLVVGLAVQCLLIAGISLTTVLLSRRWWTGIVGFVPFVIGTGSWLMGDGDWLTALSGHAVLWPPAAVLYTLNGESVALSIGALAILALILVLAKRLQGRAASIACFAAFGAVGSLANVQTYGFLVSVFMIAIGGAALGLLRSRSVAATALTLAAAGLLPMVGTWAARDIGQLAALALGLLPALPGLWVLMRSSLRRTMALVATFAAAASPQFISTGVGFLRQDEFLLYREGSSQFLGVPLREGVWCAGALLPALVLLLVLGVRYRKPVWIVAPVAVSATWLLVASNDHWGANQEPYRMWLDVLVLASVITIPVTVWALISVFQRSGKVVVEPAVLATATATATARGAAVPATGLVRDTAGMSEVDTAATPAPAVSDRAVEAVGVRDVPLVDRGADGGSARLEPRRWVRVVFALVSVVVVVVAGVWSLEVVQFRRAVTAWGYVPLAGPGIQAEARLAGLSDGRLVLTDACVDPVILKAAWGGPVAYFSRGLAWPDSHEAIDAAVIARTEPSTFNQREAMSAGIGWLLVDSTCASDLAAATHAELVATGASVAGPAGGTLELWRLEEG